MTDDGVSKDREARLAEALRANLRKRKAQSRARIDEDRQEEADRPREGEQSD